MNDKGIYDAMNYGLKLAKGKVIGIINAGDTYEKNSLRIVNNYFKQQKDLSYLFGTVKRHYLGNNVITKCGFDKRRIKYNFDAQTSHSSGFFISSNTQKEIGLYNTDFICSADYDLFYKIFLNKKLNGCSTKKEELIGVVQAGGFSSKLGFWNHLLEETRIRINNKQNFVLIFLIFCNAIFKHYFKKLS